MLIDYLCHMPSCIRPTILRMFYYHVYFIFMFYYHRLLCYHIIHCIIRRCENVFVAVNYLILVLCLD